MTERGSVILAVASGQGGTGKTTVATSLALALAGNGSAPRQKVLFLDCDVEEPNAALFLRPKLQEREPVGIRVPQVDEAKCTYCGRCAKVCAYHALAVVRKSGVFFSELCHGCGSCTLNCPEQAIQEVPHVMGILQWGYAGPIEFAQGTLNIGEAMPGPVIRQLKKRYLSRGLQGKGEAALDGTVGILDAPPVTSCPVAETMRGADSVLLVTEPTVSGRHDLERALATVDHFWVPALVCVNKADLHAEHAGGIVAFCAERVIDVVGQLPYDDVVTQAMVQGQAVTDFA